MVGQSDSIFEMAHNHQPARLAGWLPIGNIRWLLWAMSNLTCVLAAEVARAVYRHGNFLSPPLRYIAEGQQGWTKCKWNRWSEVVRGCIEIEQAIISGNGMCHCMTLLSIAHDITHHFWNACIHTHTVCITYSIGCTDVYRWKRMPACIHTGILACTCSDTWNHTSYTAAYTFIHRRAYLYLVSRSFRAPTKHQFLVLYSLAHTRGRQARVCKLLPIEN